MYACGALFAAFLLFAPGQYYFCFETNDNGTFSGKPDVSLSVTGPLKVVKREQNKRVTLTCTSTSPPNSGPTYIWYRNRQPVGDKYTTSGNTLVINPVSSADWGHFSCALRGHEDRPSPPVCVSTCWSVTYTHQKICALEGSSVDIRCYYSYPSGYVIRKPLWKFNLGSGEKTMDFSVKNTHYKNKEYLGNKKNDCSLRIKELVRHTGQYFFRFETVQEDGRWNGKPAVSLIVTGPLKVEKQEWYWRVTLTCISTCPADSRPTYIWYKNTQPVGDKYTTSGNTLMINSPVSKDDSGHFSCALRGHEDHPSPPVCVSSCSSVTYTHQEICGLEDSSVDITCSYSYPSGYVVRKPLWISNLGSGEETMDFSVKNTHDNDVEYIGNKDTDCSLRIKELSVKHRGKYYFKFSTNEDDEEFSGKPEVSLSVTGLQINMNSDTVEEGKSVRLTCSTTCTLSEPPSYIWYKNSQPIADQQTPMKSLRLNPVRIEDSGLYSCAVRGHENRPSPVRALSVSYAPRNVSVSLSFPGYILEGSSVTVTCNSDANPPATYTWFKEKRDRADGRGQRWTISNISSEFSGQYHCRAQNSVKYSDSEPFLLDVHYGPKNTTVLITPSGDIVEGDSVTLTCSSDANPPVHSYTWYKISRVSASLGSEQKHFMTNISSGDMGQYYCVVANTVGSSNSAVRHVNVFYSPKNTNVIVSSSSEGRSVTLTCNADANPPVHTYSWYRKTSSVSVLMDTGNSSSYTGVSDGDSYYCAVHNEYGSHNSSEIEVSLTALLQQTGVPGGVFAALGIILVVAVIVVLVFVRRKGKGISTTENTSTMVEHRQGEEPSPVYEDASAVLLTSNQEDRVDSGRDRVDTGGDRVDSGRDGVVSGGDSVVSGGDQVDAGGDEDDVQYASVQFKPKIKDAAQDSPAVLPQEKKVEEEESAYASVKFRSPSRDVNQDEDDTAIYSIVNKPRS
ncbi:B-cell receptor CD22-like [Sardina pilchardus]|uniref:B-cell receptor CD22-like n=1 Tax=Sardina pilchardus TaxID=27697 RepID=UPI002E118C57